MNNDDNTRNENDNKKKDSDNASNQMTFVQKED